MREKFVWPWTCIVVNISSGKIADLKTIAEMQMEEARKADKLVSNLEIVLANKERSLEEIQSRFKETSNSFYQLKDEREKLHQQYNEELKKDSAKRLRSFSVIMRSLRCN